MEFTELLDLDQAWDVMFALLSSCGIRTSVEADVQTPARRDIARMLANAGEASAPWLS